VARPARKISRSSDPLQHDPEKRIAVFRKDHAQTKKIECDDDSKKKSAHSGDEYFTDVLKYLSNENLAGNGGVLCVGTVSET
jgi:hypothetical protein